MLTNYYFDNYYGSSDIDMMTDLSPLELPKFAYNFQNHLEKVFDCNVLITDVTYINVRANLK